MKLFSRHSNDLVGIDLNKPGSARGLNQVREVGVIVNPDLFKFVIVGIFCLLAIIGWLGWRWYEAGFQRDNGRLGQISQLVTALQKYQEQFAVFPVGKNWLGFFTNLPGLELFQDPLVPSKFYFYCPTANGYLAGAVLERAPQTFNQKNLAQGLALNSCLTSTGLALKSLSCSGPGRQGEFNGIKAWVWCAGNL